MLAGGPLVFFALTDLFVVVGMVYDRMTRGRVHPAYWWGGGFLLASQAGTPRALRNRRLARLRDLAHPLTAVDFDLRLSIEVLERTPATMSAMLRGLSEPWVSGTEGPDTFSPFDVVGHLIDGEETDWMPRARIILARGAGPASSSPTIASATARATWTAR